MEFINNIITALMNNVPFPINYGILSIITGSVSFMFFPFFGYIINEFEEMEIRMLARIFGMNFALFIAARLTFIGTITHECAHAFFAWLFGAKVGEVKLLTFHHRNELGHVRYFPRGNIIMQHLQMFFTSCAPVIVNTFLTALIIYNWKNIHRWYLYILAIYLIISFMNHASMSDTDLDHYFHSGKIVIPLTIGVLFICLLIFRPV